MSPNTGPGEFFHRYCERELIVHKGWCSCSQSHTCLVEYCIRLRKLTWRHVETLHTYITLNTTSLYHMPQVDFGFSVPTISSIADQHQTCVALLVFQDNHQGFRDSCSIVGECYVGSWRGNDMGWRIPLKLFMLSINHFVESKCSCELRAPPESQPISERFSGILNHC